MDFGRALSIIQVILALVMIAILLIQTRGDNASIFGSATTVARSRRGVEKLLFNATIVIAAIFMLIAILNVRFG